MCYHTKQTKPATEVQRRFNATIEKAELFKSSSHFNAFDFPLMPIILNENQNLIQFGQWGLIPDYKLNSDIKKYTLNARIESIHQKESFKDYEEQRCLILADGFYEWKWLDSKGKIKNKYEIGIENYALFSFAGLFSHWKNPQTNELMTTFTMLTTVANELMSEIHNIKKRMPIILHQKDEESFLSGEELERFSFPNYEIKLVAKNLEAQQRLFD